MPQLIPTPWFMYLLLSWMVYLLTVLPKVSAHISPENPAPQTKQKLQTTPWSWPWV